MFSTCLFFLSNSRSTCLFLSTNPAAMASGVGVADDCVTTFNDLKLKHQLKYIVYNMNAGMTQIEVLKTAGKEATYEQFMAEFPDGECRYGVFDAEYTDPKTGGQRNKIVFYIWCSDQAKIKQKMIFASSKDELKKRLVGVAVEVQASDKSEMEYSEVVDRINRTG